MRGNAGVRKRRDVRPPTEGSREPLDAGVRRAVRHVRRIAAAAKRMQAADAEIAARHKNRAARRAPAFARQRRDELPHRREPVGRSGLVEAASPHERERHEFTAIGPEHGARLQRDLSAQQRGMRGGGVTEGGDASGGFETNGGG